MRKESRWVDFRGDGPRTLPLNSLTNITAYKDPRWMELFRELGTYSYDTHFFNADSAPKSTGRDGSGPRPSGASSSWT